MSSRITFTRPEPEGSTWLKLLSALLALAFIHALVILFLGIDKPLLDMHYFRQTQTALTSFWILKGGPWLAYETPVVGYPWAVPFEFPLYQLLVAAVAWLGVPLDVAGRLVGFGFFLAMLWPLRMLYAALGLGRASFLTTSTLYLTSPLYLYWSRTFLMETTALFFSLCWLALTATYLITPNRYRLLGATVCGCLAMLAKSTTFPAFAVVGGLLILFRLWQSAQADPQRHTIRIAVASTINLLFPFVIGILWVGYSDHIKNANAFGRMLTSEALSGWSFGQFGQKLSSVLWIDTVRNRVLPDTLGRYVFVSFIVLGATLTSRRTLVAALIALLGFAVPFLVFTNLHIVHNYYQSSNAIFLIVAIGLGLGRIFDSSQRAAAVVLMIAIVTGQLLFFYERFAPYLTRDYGQDQLLRIAQSAKDHTGPDNSVLVIGDEWASTIPYYAQRRALVVPAWTPKPLFKEILRDPQQFLGNVPLGAVVYCTDKLASYQDMIPAVQEFIAGRKLLDQFHECQLFSASR